MITEAIIEGKMLIDEQVCPLTSIYLGSTIVWPLDPEPIPEPTVILPKDTVAGDVLYTDGNQIVFCDGSLETAQFLHSVGYTPIGVVVVPGTHNVYGDKSCGVMSLKLMNCSRPATGGTTEQDICWGVQGTDISLLSNLDYVPVGNTEDGIPTSQANWSYLPSDRFSGTQCIHDTDTFYYDTVVEPSPSPYLTDGSRNPGYYQTTSPSSSSNALADFNGIANTNKIIAQRGDKDYTSWKPNPDTEADYPAASCCNMFYTRGTIQTDWYLPAMGELGYIISRFNKINGTITNLQEVYKTSISVTLRTGCDYWSSSESNADSARKISSLEGGLDRHNKNYYSKVRAFLRVNESGIVSTTPPA